MPGTAEQKRQERASRKANGMKRIEVWILPNVLSDLTLIQDFMGLSSGDALSRSIVRLASEIRHTYHPAKPNSFSS